MCENLYYSVPFLDTSLDCCTTWGDKNIDSDMKSDCESKAEQNILVSKGVNTNKPSLLQRLPKNKVKATGFSQN